MRGVWCQALSLPRQPVLWGGQPGFRDPCVPGAVGVGVGTQHRPHSVLESRHCALWGWRKGVTRGGALRRCGGRLSSVVSPPPGCPPSGRAVGVRYPRAVGAGVRVWGRSTVPVACMPCEGLCTVGSVWVQAPPLPRLPALWAGCRGPLSTCCQRGCGCVRCVWCLCGACRGAWCCPSSAPWWPPLWCFVAVLCSSCACRALFPARVPRLAAGYLRLLSLFRRSLPFEAGSDPPGHLWVTWGVYLCAGKPPSADIILSHPPDLTRCDSVIGLAIPAMSGHIQYRGAAS